MSELSCGLYDDVATWLEAMGDDPHTVAVTLQIEEVRGVRGSVFAHPVCRWLSRLVPDLYAVLGAETIQVFRPAGGAGIQGVLVPLPAPVRTFANRFDDGQHPELELWVGAPVATPAPDPGSDTVQIPAVPASASPVGERVVAVARFQGQHLTGGGSPRAAVGGVRSADCG